MHSRLLILLFFYSFINVKAQNVTIELSYKYDKSTPYFSRDSFYFQLNKTLYPLYTGEVLKYKVKSIKFSKTDEILKTICTYELLDTSLSIIADMYGHEMVLLPNDTIRIYSTQESSKKRLPWERNFAFSGPNQYIHSIFDSLAYLTGDLKMDILDVRGKSIAECIKQADNRFDMRLKYLDCYCEKYHIGSVINNLVGSEIYAAYVKDLAFIQSSQRMSTHPQDLVKLISSKIDFNRLKAENFQKTVVATQVIYEYLLYLKVPFDKANFYSKTRFVKVYDLIKQNYQGDRRDDMLTMHMGNFIGSGFATFISRVMVRYKSDCKNKKSVAYIDSLYKTKMALSRLTYNEVINIGIKDLEGKLQTLKNVVEGKPTLIDCWASWCKPCSGEFPSSKILEEAYKGKINFIYLSFDKDAIAWKSKVKELNVTSTYQVIDNFSSGFAAYFKITAIPPLYFNRFKRKPSESRRSSAK